MCGTTFSHWTSGESGGACSGSVFGGGGGGDGGGGDGDGDGDSGGGGG